MKRGSTQIIQRLEKEMNDLTSLDHIIKYNENSDNNENYKNNSDPNYFKKPNPPQEGRFSHKPIFRRFALPLSKL